MCPYELLNLYTLALNTLDFKCAVVTGGGGGLGRAMADELLMKGKDHPEVDCLINNAGIQRPLDVNDSSLEEAYQEIDINIRGPMHLTIDLLPHFKSKPSATIMNAISLVGYIPFSVINLVYNGTKAWAHFWSMNLRTQLAKEQGSKNIKVVKIVPLRIAIHLHGGRKDPNDNKENNSDALLVDKLMSFVTKGWLENQDTIGAGMDIDIADRWHGAFGEEYAEAERE
ncbi:short-chain dehydrogenase [Calycina marina]|uniref:Short-chain dehydrogenase n=1 Tax=Calycina marina TaxID=1763456 RepID=A0A9P8CE07_9HELO|nr:short-chain dehydrogenase [Calycina marina]